MEKQIDFQLVMVSDKDYFISLSVHLNAGFHSDEGGKNISSLRYADYHITGKKNCEHLK